MAPPKKSNPWQMMQAHDVARFGEVIFDPVEQRRWCTAVFIGGLPYMWKGAGKITQHIYERLELKSGDKVLLIGESNESCGFVGDLSNQVGPSGTVHSIDVIERARDMCSTGQRGKNGKLGTWRYDFVDETDDNYYDAVALLQGVQHTEDWHETAAQLLRVLKPGGTLVTGEICFGEPFAEKVRADAHIQYVMEKLFAGIGIPHEDMSYWSVDDLREAFKGLLVEQGWFVDRGFEVFWGRKPTGPKSMAT